MNTPTVHWDSVRAQQARDMYRQRNRARIRTARHSSGVRVNLFPSSLSHIAS